MIYEQVLQCVDDLSSRWNDVQESSGELVLALGGTHPNALTVREWQAQSWIAVNWTTAPPPVIPPGLLPGATPPGIPSGSIPGTIFVPSLGGITSRRPSLLGFPSLAGLLSTARDIFHDADLEAVRIEGSALGATGVLTTLTSSTDGRIVAAATVLQARLEALRRLINECLQELVEIATQPEGQGANLARIRGSVDDISTYPVLTQEMGGYFPMPSIPGAGGGAPPALGQRVLRAMAEVLGQRPRANDTRSFLAALNQSFTCKEEQGRTICTWAPRAGVSSTELGGSLTGAQASLYERARVALDASLPMLDRLLPLRPDFDPQEVEASRAVVRTETSELVTELGWEGGPRVQRVDDLFELLLDRDFTVLPDGPGGGLPISNGLNDTLRNEVGKGELGRLGDVFGITRGRVNTLEEERNLTDFVMVRDYLTGLRASWNTFRPNFLGGVDTFLGTQLVLLQRTLAVVAESVAETEFAMDSVFLGPAERQTVRIYFPQPFPPMFVQDLLAWVQRYASDEAPNIVTDGGKKGTRALVPTLRRLRDLVTSAQGRIQHPGARHPRVRQTLNELASHLDEAARLAGSIQ